MKKSSEQKDFKPQLITLLSTMERWRQEDEGERTREKTTPHDRVARLESQWEVVRQTLIDIPDDSEVMRILKRRVEYFNTRYQALCAAQIRARARPPKIAEFLLTALATSRAAEAMIGDLNERFTCDCERFGQARAVRLYWARALRSLWPLLKRAIGKAMRWGAVIATVRRLF